MGNQVRSLAPNGVKSFEYQFTKTGWKREGAIILLTHAHDPNENPLRIIDAKWNCKASISSEVDPLVKIPACNSIRSIEIHGSMPNKITSDKLIRVGLYRTRSITVNTENRGREGYIRRSSGKCPTGRDTRQVCRWKEIYW